MAFCLFHRKNHSAARAIPASNTSPPTTPPAIAPALDCDFPEEAEEDRVNIDDDEVDEDIGTLALVVETNEDVETGALVASDEQVISFRWSWSDLYGLLC